MAVSQHYSSCVVSAAPFGGWSAVAIEIPRFRSYLAPPWAKFRGPSGAKAFIKQVLSNPYGARHDRESTLKPDEPANSRKLNMKQTKEI